MRITNRERRDWTLIIFIIPIGIILMMIAGQIAVRVVPQWSVNAGMKSLLDPQNAPKQEGGLIQPVLPEILTPIGWLDTFLTPNSDPGDEDIVFPPFVVFEPTSTPSPTNSPEASPTITITKTPTASPPPSASPTTVTTVPSATKTQKPPNDKTPTPPTVTTTATATPTATATGIPSTIDPSLTSVIPPAEKDIGTPDGNPGVITPGNYIILNVGGNPVLVDGNPDYDLVYYESDAGGNVFMDSVVVGISHLVDGSVYYEVFNWGDNNRDTNTNVDTNTLPADPACTASPPECDNRSIPTGDLYNGTGVLIDVDNAPSAPPAGTYDYIVVISPQSGAPDGAQVDAVEVVPTP
jgi:hypothetical protein